MLHTHLHHKADRLVAQPAGELGVRVQNVLRLLVAADALKQGKGGAAAEDVIRQRACAPGIQLWRRGVMRGGSTLSPSNVA